MPEAGSNIPILKQAFGGALGLAERQVERLITKHPDYFPLYTEGGQWKHTGEAWTNWCEGFLPGQMWIFHEVTGKPEWRERAEHYSRLVEPRKDDRQVHDLGFLFFHGTYRRWYDVTVRDGKPESALKDVVVHAGRTLALRYQAKGRYLCSFVAPESCFIDILMNVPVVWYAGIETNDEALLSVARNHCATSRRYLVRGDGSTAHEGIFDVGTGEFLKQTTHQGYRGDSCWSRGLTWAVYGFATCARLTNDQAWLNTSMRCAEYLLEQLVKESVPPWDFDAPEPQRAQKDSSAAAIAAAGLFELADALDQIRADNAIYSGHLRTYAMSVLLALCNERYLPIGDDAWEGTLKHGVYHLHKGLGVEESVMWGEFFFCDALQRALALLDRGFEPGTS
jgi:unsaturated chondroitin disaccharide hydrolase